MNHEIISILATEEYLNAFYEKDIRPDQRKKEDIRSFSYINNILNSEKFSCLASLGDGNRLIAVLKYSDSTNANLSVKCQSNDTDNNIIISYIDKLLINNIIFKTTMNYELHIKIINTDGNVFDLIASMINRFFNEEAIMYNHISIINQFKTLTFGEIKEHLIFDPTKEEFASCKSVFNMILFNDSFTLFKIRGGSLKSDLSKIFSIIKTR